MTKICHRCCFEKPIEFFPQVVGFKNKQCSDCRKEIRRASYLKRREKELAKQKEYYQKNKEKHKQTVYAWMRKNRQKRIEATKRWCQKYPEKVAAQQKRRLEALKQRTPKWLTPEQLLQIKLFFKNKPKGMVVDHIVPLRGENVSGLNVLWNLQYLDRSTNSQKSNKLLKK